MKDKEQTLIWSTKKGKRESLAMRYREEKLFLELGLNQGFRKVRTYVLPPVMSTNSASWLCQECSEIQGLDATTAPRLHPEVGIEFI